MYKQRYRQKCVRVRFGGILSVQRSKVEKKTMSKQTSQVDKIVAGTLAAKLDSADRGSVIGFVLANRTTLESLQPEEAARKVMTGCFPPGRTFIFSAFNVSSEHFLCDGALSNRNKACAAGSKISMALST